MFADTGFVTQTPTGLDFLHIKHDLVQILVPRVATTGMRIRPQTVLSQHRLHSNRLCPRAVEKRLQVVAAPRAEEISIVRRWRIRDTPR